ncbi:MAG: hypothetical protein H0U71_05760 [Gammaproteobacteria bacterium]|nr:hypothetical protein [Gammaproteobacteria bacterium]
MADDKKNPDEYEYPSDEYYKGGEYIPPADESTDPLDPGSRPRSFLSRRMLVLLGLFLAIGLVYLVLMFTNARKNADLAQPTPTTDVAVANIPPTGVPQPVQQVPAPAPADNSALLNGAQQNQITQQNMATLQTQLQQLQAQVGEVTTSIAALNNRIQVVANEIKAIAVDRGMAGRGYPVGSPGTIYQLKALVPGRAWLQSGDGSTTTVSIGDRLPGYGIIQMINVDQGIVTTSSGALIQYGKRDS